MDHPKKILILYASAGHGHEKAARALGEACEALGSSWSVEVVDSLSKTPSFFGRSYASFYIFLIKYAPWLWGFFYYVSDIAWIYFFLRPIRRLVNSFAARDLEKFMIEKDPSVIITTHFLSTEVASHLKQRKLIHSRLFTVVTDYQPHFIWTADAVNGYVVALEDTMESLVKKGVRAEKIRVLGIPIAKKFAERHSREALCNKLRLRSKIFTVLITSGGAGVGTISNIVRGLLDLKKPIQILVVCGTNKKLLDGLAKISKDTPLLKVFGFVHNMDELMEVSDLVVGKGGGLTITESHAEEKPMILFRSVPGQEMRNARCVEKYRAGFTATRASAVVSKVSELLDAPERLETMKKGIRQMSCPTASQDIARWIQSL